MKVHKYSALRVLLFFIFSFVGCNTINNKTQDDNGKEIVLRLEPTPGNLRNSEGDFIKLNDGRILFVYTKFTTGSSDYAQAHLASRISNDNGKTWSKEDIVVVPNEGTMNVISVSMLRLADGRIAMFHLRKNSEVDCIPYMRISTDEAKTWSDAVKCIDIPGYYVLNNNRVVQLKGGRIIFPVALHNTPDINNFFNGRIMCYYSDDNGETWNKSQQVSNPSDVTSQEPGIVELENGKIMLFCRTDAGVQYFSYSNDQGESWTHIEPGNIKSPLSPASIKRIPATGDLLLVWNNNFQSEEGGGGKRTPFNLAISKDEGKTWERIKTLESDPDGWYCYTAIEFADDHVLLAHCAGKRKIGISGSGLATTQITRLSLDWIYREAIPAP